MVDPNKLPRNVSPLTVVPDAVKLLERLRDSYQGLSGGRPHGRRSGCSGGSREFSEALGQSRLTTFFRPKTCPK